MTDDKPSATALVIARGIIFIATDDKFGHLVPAGAAEASEWFLRQGLPDAERLLKRIRKGWFRSILRAAEQITIPGIALHYVLRKRFIEDVARNKLSDGISQVVVLGAGFDTLALRLYREFPNVTFIEVDHPATQRVKRAALERHALPGANMQMLPLDLMRHNLEHTLLTCAHYSPTADTLFIAEGLTMYLASEEMDAIFRFIEQHSGERSMFVFTFMEPQRDGRVNFPSATKLVNWWLRIKGEPFTWGIKRNDLGGFLAARNSSLREIATPETFRQRYLNSLELKNISLTEGEYVCVAEKFR